MLKTYQVPFLCGDGSGEIMLTVTYIAVFPRDEKTFCAFCHGDPCNEDKDPNSEIYKFFQRNKNAESCPCCDGRPS